MTTTPVRSPSPTGSGSPSRRPPRNPRAHRRRVLQLIGIVPLVLAIAFFVKVVVMIHHDHAGQTAWDERDGATALQQYAANRSTNFLERWLAPFDAGDAAFLLTDYDRAAGYYRAALGSVPHEHECTVRINLSLADEKIGDAASTAGDRDAATKAWKDGIATLDAGHCPTHAGQGKRQTKDAATVRKRLEDKLKTPPQQQSQQQQGQKQQPQQSPKEKDKLKDLDKNNNQGRDDRDRSQHDDDYNDFGYDYQW